jgi:hypothetical protein
MRDDALPSHPAKTDKAKSCRDSGYSPHGRTYVVKTPAEARELAQWMQNDLGFCLDRPGSRRHSLACGDGRNCEEERLRLSKALAVFYLQNEQEKRREAARKLAELTGRHAG